MRFISKIYQKFRFISLLLLGIILFSGTVYSQSTIEKARTTTNYKLKVVDQQEQPVADVQVLIGDRLVDNLTDENGIISLQLSKNDIVYFLKHGYERSLFTIDEIAADNTILLKKSVLLGTSDDEIAVPFGKIKKRFATGNYYSIQGNQLEKYPTNDIRNAFVGIAPGVEVLEKDGSIGLSAEERLGSYGITQKIGISARGMGMKYIIDDLAVDITELPLDPDEIESVTIIKDVVGKAMFGPEAANGVIYIKTKRGKNKERKLSVNYEQGISSIDRFPQWVAGADYVRLNNLARTNSGLNPLYSDQDIAAYGNNDAYDMLHPNVDFKGMMLNNTKDFRRANFSSSGGNENLQYTAYLGYNGEGDIYKIGSESDYSRLVARSNLDFKINEFIKIKLSLYGGLTSRRSPNYGYATTEANSTTDLVEFNSVIDDIISTPAIAFPIYAKNDPTLSTPWYGVSSLFKGNPIANITRNGYYTESGRIGSSNIAFEYDMKSILSGLKSTTFIGINTFNLTRIGKAQRAPSYVVTPTGATDGSPTYNLSLYEVGIDESAFLRLHDFYTQRYVFFQNFNYDKTFGKHSIQSSATYYLSKAVVNGTKNPDRLQNIILNGSYTYDNKYTIQGVLNYSGSGSFAKDKRYALFPSLGINWVVSEEKFMSGLNFIDFLKIRSEYGTIGYDDLTSTFAYQDQWNRGTLSGFGPHSLNRWFGTTTSSLYSTTAGRTGNPSITWEKRKEFSLGLDALMLNKKLLLEMTYYNNLREGQLTQVQNYLPYSVGVSNALPYFNYNSTKYFGLELELSYTNTIGKLKYSLGGNATIQNTKRVKYDEPNYRFDYQKRTGTSTDSYWGQTYLGTFQNDAETDIVPQLFDEQLHAGDLKYKDMNGDGFIDDNDVSAIGHTTPRLFYGLTANLSYKNFELTIIGSGRAFYDLPMTNQYFWNGWGDSNYSNFVLQNSLEGNFPKQTYNKVNNNFIASDFLLTKGGYFKIQNIELAYNVPATISKVIGSNGVRVYVRGANLMTFSKVKDVDPESVDSGITSYPLFRTFTAGFKFNF